MTHVECILPGIGRAERLKEKILRIVRRTVLHDLLLLKHLSADVVLWDNEAETQSISHISRSKVSQAERSMFSEEWPKSNGTAKNEKNQEGRSRKNTHCSTRWKF